MINIYDYCAVNWEATSDNIRALLYLDRISIALFAKSMCVTERTIYNWCNNKAKPDIDKLVLMAIFFDVDILDIIVTNGQVNNKLEMQDLEDLDNLIRQKEEEDYDENNDIKYECNYEEEFAHTVLMNEYIKQRFPIRTLNEFLLYLPLVDINKISNFLYRIEGNIGTNNYYVLKQLEILYNDIINKDARNFADWYKDFYLTYPKINEIDDKTKIEEKLIKFDDWKDTYEKNILESKSLYNSYENEYKIFLKKLKIACSNIE